MRIRTLIIGLVLLALSSMTVSSGPNPSSQALRIPYKSQDHLTPAQHKISPLLRHTCSQLEEAKATSYNAKTLRIAERFSSPLVKVDDTARVQVYLKVDSVDDDVQEILKSVGVEIEIVNEEWNLIQAWVPYDYIEIVADFEFILKVQTPDYGTFSSSLVNVDGGDELSLPPTVGEFDIDGSGVRVGVISGGMKSLTDTVERGDLPNDILETGSCATPGCDEGTPMLDVIYTTAPGVTAGFCAPGPTLTTLSFINCVTWLTNTFEANVIVDDVVFVAQPYFEDGMVAQTVAHTVASSVTYISTAGNFAQGHYEADFVENVDFTGISIHDFGVAAGGAGDVFDSVGNATDGWVVPPGECVTVTLQWNDPWGASSNDYDVLIFDFEQNLLNAPGAGQVVQDGDDNPQEAVEYCNRSAVPVSTSIVVQKLSGQGRRIEMFVQITDVADSIPHHEHTVVAGSIIGHQAGQGVLTVAGVRDDEYGLQQVPSSTSRGPSDIYHPAFESRTKPDLAGLDCVKLTSAGGVHQTVCGASVAAARVAGIAALLLEANPDLTVQQVSDVLTSTATDIDAANVDVHPGLGLVDAVAALNADIVLSNQTVAGMLRSRGTAPSLGAFVFEALIPSDLDGSTPPPAGSPNYFMRHRDDEVHNPGANNPSNDFLEIFEFHTDFATPANSTFTGPTQIPITDIDSDLCGLVSFACFPQPNTGTTLDPLREVIMWRLQYRNFGTHETLVGNFVTDVDGTDHGGIRWFELRKTGGGPGPCTRRGRLPPTVTTGGWVVSPWIRTETLLWATV